MTAGKYIEGSEDLESHFVSITYFCMAKECLGLVVKLPTAVSYGAGIAAAVLFLSLFLRATKKAA